MRWTPGKISPNIEDRRGQRGQRGQRGIALSGLGAGGGGALLLILGLLFGRNLFDSVDLSATPADSGVVDESAAEKRLVQFVSVVLDDAQATWMKELPAHGAQYRDARLVLFRSSVRSACGYAESAMGPFYCPLDEKVYIDLGFYDDLRARYGAPGDFAQAYVIAHEIGHHVQHVLGTSSRVRALQERRPESANQLSVRLELQADCYAGIWGHSTDQRRLLEQGDTQEALGAASAVGDDRLQRRSTGSVNTESFTHGTAVQRMSWFKRGFESGDPRLCDTFATETVRGPDMRKRSTD